MLKGRLNSLILLWEIHIKYALKFSSNFNNDRTFGNLVVDTILSLR